jgi:MtN3 and saliva related transmembrane protein
MNDVATQLIGWLSAGTLLVTLVTQIVGQWRDHTSKGVSPWLFIGQICASIGFIVYSVLTDNVVFIVTNSLIAAVAVFGQYTYLRNRKRSVRK